MFGSDKVSCPKSLAIWNKGGKQDAPVELYTGTLDGKVVKITANNEGGNQDQTEIVAQFENGRPLGMRITSKGILYFIEANSGLYSFDLNEKKLDKVLG